MVQALGSRMAKQLLKHTPSIAAKPLAIVPFALKAKIIASLLRQMLQQQMGDGELAFLQQRTVAVTVTDLKLAFVVQYDGDWLVTPRIAGQAADVSFSAASQELLLIAASKEDPDTLFFQRRLVIEGDTELGLEVKNLLLQLELDALPLPVRLSVTALAASLMHLQRSAEYQSQ